MDVVDGAEGDLVVEEVAKEFDDPAQRTVPDEHQAERELLDPTFGNGEVEQDRRVGGWRVKGAIQRLSCEVLLSVNELAADVGVSCEGGDGLCAGQSVERQALALLGSQRVGGWRVDNGGVDRRRRWSRNTHACFL